MEITGYRAMNWQALDPNEVVDVKDGTSRIARVGA